MVDPISEAERAAFVRRAKWGVTLLVAVSAGLVASQADATLAETAGAVAAGLLVGYPIARFAVPSGPAPATRQRRRRESEAGSGVENPFADGGDPADAERDTDRPDRRTDR